MRLYYQNTAAEIHEVSSYFVMDGRRMVTVVSGGFVNVVPIESLTVRQVQS